MKMIIKLGDEKVGELILVEGATIDVNGSTPERGTIKGTVSDSKTNHPLLGVTVETDNLATTTDIDGNFCLEVSPGDYAVKFTKLDYKTKIVR